jgi:hypothetical protein
MGNSLFSLCSCERMFELLWFARHISQLGKIMSPGTTSKHGSRRSSPRDTVSILVLLPERCSVTKDSKSDKSPKSAPPSGREIKAVRPQTPGDRSILEKQGGQAAPNKVVPPPKSSKLPQSPPPPTSKEKSLFETIYDGGRLCRVPFLRFRLYYF